MNRTRALKGLCCATLLLFLAACAAPDARTGQRVLTGAAVGAASGAVVGAMTGGMLGKTAVGAAAGAVGGYVYDQLRKQQGEE